MLDHLLLKHKAVVGKGGLAERQPGGRVTRALRLAWQRSLGAADLHPSIQPRRIPSALDFDGSISEWNLWRRKEVEQKRRARLGLPPLEDANDQGAAGMSKYPSLMEMLTKVQSKRSPVAHPRVAAMAKFISLLRSLDETDGAAKRRIYLRSTSSLKSIKESFPPWPVTRLSRQTLIPSASFHPVSNLQANTNGLIL